MKKIILIILAVILALGIGFFVIYVRSTANGDPVKPFHFPTTGRQCFQYDQVATKDAPYTVNETIDITADGDKITGTKVGNQSGPDMTNGYTGTITGMIKDNIITSVFTYTIEGSKNQEQEEYEATRTGLIKHRYPLKEVGKMLVPDTTGTVKNLTYIRVECQ